MDLIFDIDLNSYTPSSLRIAIRKLADDVNDENIWFKISNVIITQG